MMHKWGHDLFRQVYRIGPTRFLRREDGAVALIFGLALVLLLTAIGVAIDMARYNIARNRMQHALDMAVLSAAAVQSSQDPEEVANTFFLANYPADTFNTTFTTGNPSAPVEITVSPAGLGITGSVEGKISTLFGPFVGLNEMTIEREAEVLGMGDMIAEVVLMMDMSASMCRQPGYNNVFSDPSCAKFNGMRDAARLIVNELFSDDPDNLYMGIVPFSHTVRTRGTARHPLLDATSSPSSVYTGNTYPPPYLNATNYGLLPDAKGLDNRKGQLLSYINNLTLSYAYNAYTRTNVGTMAAGLMLMPFTEERGYFNHISIPDGELPHDFAPGRVQKILVLMTDGVNFAYYNPDGTPFRSAVDDNHQRQLCDQLKNHYGVRIFSVIFDLDGPQADASAPGTVANIFANCATSTDDFYNAADVSELLEAYRRIGESITRIRLSR